MNERRKKKIKSRGAGNHKAPHCLNAHMWTTVHQRRKKKTQNTHIHMDTCRQSHTVHSLSHSTIGWHGLKRKTEQQRTGRGRPQTRRGKQWGLMNWASTIGGYRSAVGETAVPYFLTDRPSWKIPHRPQVHQFILVLWSEVSSANDSNSSCDFDSVLSIKSGRRKTYCCFYTRVLFSPSVKLG